VLEAESGGKSPDRRSNAAVRSSNTFAIHANDDSMEVRSDPIESAKSHFFDTSNWSEFCDVTLTLKQGHQPDSGGWVKIDAGTANVCVYYPSLKKARSAPAHYVHGSVVSPVDSSVEEVHEVPKSLSASIVGGWSTVALFPCYSRAREGCR
jgi:hypothetical protein